MAQNETPASFDSNQVIQVLADSGVFHVWIQFCTVYASTCPDIKVCLISFYEGGVYEDEWHVVWVLSLCI